MNKNNTNKNQNLIPNQNIKIEILAGITTFIASVYIIMTNALILSDAGINTDAAMISTILTCCISTLLMGMISNTPLILVPGMGINSLFTYTIVQSMGLSWQDALGTVFVSGIIFTVIASTRLTTILMDSIPKNLKHAITTGVGLLILFIGLQKGGLVISNENTMISIGNIANKETILCIITLLIIFILNIKKVPGNILISIIIGTILSLFMGITSLDNMNFSEFNILAIKDVFLSMSFKNIYSVSFWVAVFSITIVIIFENMGILYGQLGAINREDDFKKAFRVPGISNIIAGILGTSPTIIAAENFSGISAGGKSKIASFTSAILFLLSLFLIPILKLIPNGVISSILIFIGILMIETFFDLEKGDSIEIISIILMITIIPFTYNIVTGISIGFIVYTVLNLIINKGKNLSIPMYILSGLFILNFVMSISMGIIH